MNTIYNNWIPYDKPVVDEENLEQKQQQQPSTEPTSPTPIIYYRYKVTTGSLSNHITS